MTSFFLREETEQKRKRKLRNTTSSCFPRRNWWRLRTNPVCSAKETTAVHGPTNPCKRGKTTQNYQAGQTHIHSSLPLQFEGTNAQNALSCDGKTKIPSPVVLAMVSLNLPIAPLIPALRHSIPVQKQDKHCPLLFCKKNPENSICIKSFALNKGKSHGWVGSSSPPGIFALCLIFQPPSAKVNNKHNATPQQTYSNIKAGAQVNLGRAYLTPGEPVSSSMRCLINYSSASPVN